MERQGEPVDKPEPRWQVILALLAVGGIYMALPKELVLGPTWLLPVLIVALLVPTVFAHRSGYHSLNHVLGILISGIITAALIGSVVLLVANLPAKKESPFAYFDRGRSFG
jgi:Mn2+/Fe2+ NRAMP family transporter